MNPQLYKILADSFGFSSSNYTDVMRNIEDMVKKELKSKELQDSEIEEICKTLSIKCTPDIKKFSKKLETSIKQKYGIPSIN